MRSRYLPEELQARILIRLPVKVLVRFELVCKTWQSLFRSRYFIQLYAERGNINDDNGVYKTTSIDAMMKIAPQLYDHGLPDLVAKITRKELGLVFNVLGPLNNSIYCLASYVYDRGSILTGKIALCNFSIRHIKFANPFPTEIHSLLSKIKPSRLLFGFGSRDLDYKVIMIVIDLFGDHHSLLYSLKSGEWKMIDDGIRSIGERLTIQEPLEACVQRFFQGCWHWMAWNVDRHFFLLSFNFGDETFKRVNGPPCHISMDEHIESGVFVLRGHLVVVYLNKTRTRCKEVNVWKMMEYGVEDSWSKIYTLNPNCHGNFETLIGVFCKPKDGEEECGDDIETVCIGSTDRNTVDCSKKGNMASLFPHPCSTIYWNTPGVSTYMESMERF